jgi:tetratricopeptide (TPR) repeat protein
MRSLMLGAWIATFVAGVAHAQAPSRSEEEARQLFTEGQRAYDAGEFEEAVRAFRRAYLLSPRFQLLYNIGQAELRAGRDQLALEAFEGFLRQAPEDHGLRGEVAERVRVMRGLGVDGADGDGDGDRAPPPPSGATGGVDPAPWIVLGVGAAVAIGGAVLMGVGVSEADRVSNAPDGSRWPELQSIASTADTLWGTGIVMLGVGAAALVAGLAWGIAGSSSSSRSSARLRIGPFGLMIEGEL